MSTEDVTMLMNTMKAGVATVLDRPDHPYRGNHPIRRVWANDDRSFDVLLADKRVLRLTVETHTHG